MDGPLPASGNWPISRVLDVTVAQTAYQLVSNSRLWLPATKEANAIKIPVRRLSELADIGPLHRDINGKEQAGSVVRGPFDIEEIPPGLQPTYPALWAHRADAERKLLVTPDTHGIIRTGAKSETNKIIQERAAKIWATASHVHFNYDFRFNSQSTAACYTKDKSIGGRAWPSISFRENAHEKAFVLWANSTLGLLIYWWQANKTQSGRGTITLTAIPDLPIYDFDQLSSKQLSEADAIFDGLMTKPLRPVNELNTDKVRHDLDEAVLVDILGLPKTLLVPEGPFDLFRRKLAAEPSIVGGKKRPPTKTL